jgi:hypothetical protein
MGDSLHLGSFVEEIGSFHGHAASCVEFDTNLNPTKCEEKKLPQCRKSAIFMVFYE